MVYMFIPFWKQWIYYLFKTILLSNVQRSPSHCVYVRFVKCKSKLSGKIKRSLAARDHQLIGSKWGTNCLIHEERTRWLSKMPSFDWLNQSRPGRTSFLWIDELEFRRSRPRSERPIEPAHVAFHPSGRPWSVPNPAQRPLVWGDRNRTIVAAVAHWSKRL